MTVYIGEDTVWNNLIPNVQMELKNNQDYNVQFQQEGPQMIINGQPVITPDTTIWAVFQNGCKIPYAGNLIQNFWRI